MFFWNRQHQKESNDRREHENRDGPPRHPESSVADVEAATQLLDSLAGFGMPSLAAPSTLQPPQAGSLLPDAATSSLSVPIPQQLPDATLVLQQDHHEQHSANHPADIEQPVVSQEVIASSTLQAERLGPVDDQPVPNVALDTKEESRASEGAGEIMVNELPPHPIPDAAEDTPTHSGATTATVEPTPPNVVLGSHPDSAQIPAQLLATSSASQEDKTSTASETTTTTVPTQNNMSNNHHLLLPQQHSTPNRATPSGRTLSPSIAEKAALFEKNHPAASTMAALTRRHSAHAGVMAAGQRSPPLHPHPQQHVRDIVVQRPSLQPPVLAAVESDPIPGTIAERAALFEKSPQPLTTQSPSVHRPAAVLAAMGTVAAIRHKTQFWQQRASQTNLLAVETHDDDDDEEDPAVEKNRKTANLSSSSWSPTGSVEAKSKWLQSAFTPTGGGNMPVPANNQEEAQDEEPTEDMTETQVEGEGDPEQMIENRVEPAATLPDNIPMARTSDNSGGNGAMYMKYRSSLARYQTQNPSVWEASVPYLHSSSLRAVDNLDSEFHRKNGDDNVVYDYDDTDYEFVDDDDLVEAEEGVQYRVPYSEEATTASSAETEPMANVTPVVVAPRSGVDITQHVSSFHNSGPIDVDEFIPDDDDDDERVILALAELSKLDMSVRETEDLGMIEEGTDEDNDDELVADSHCVSCGLDSTMVVTPFPCDFCHDAVYCSLYCKDEDLKKHVDRCMRRQARAVAAAATSLTIPTVSNVPPEEDLRDQSDLNSEDAVVELGDEQEETDDGDDDNDDESEDLMLSGACASCGLSSTYVASMVPCDGCGEVFFCSSYCKDDDLKKHRASCTGFQNREADTIEKSALVWQEKDIFSPVMTDGNRKQRELEVSPSQQSALMRSKRKTVTFKGDHTIAKSSVDALVADKQASLKKSQKAPMISCFGSASMPPRTRSNRVAACQTSKAPANEEKTFKSESPEKSRPRSYRRQKGRPATSCII